MGFKEPTHSFLKTIRPYLIFTLASVFTIYDFAARVMPSAMTQPLMSTFHIHAASLGLLASLFFYGYMPMQIPAGMLYDKFGTRALLTFAAMSCALATLLFAFTDNLYLIYLSRFIMGFTGAFAFVGAVLVAANWFPPHKFAFFTGLVQLLGCVGAIVGLSPIAALTAQLGWRHAAMMIALTGLFFSLLIWLIIRDAPANEKNSQSEHHAGNTLSGLKQIIRSKQTWAVGLFGFSCWAPISVFAALWGVPFLMTLYHESATKASAETSLIWIGIAIASPIMGWLSNALASRRTPLLLCSALAFLSACGIIYLGPITHYQMAILLVLLGVSAGSQVVTFGLVLDNNRDATMGTAVGFNNMAVVTGGLFLQPLVGLIMQWEWSKHYLMLDGSPVYSLHAYHWALALIPITSLIGFITAKFFIRETHCQRLHDRTIRENYERSSIDSSYQCADR